MNVEVLKMSTNELLKLKKKLPKGYRKELAVHFNCSTAYIDMVFAGSRINNTIISKAVELAQAHKHQMQILKLEINSL